MAVEQAFYAPAPTVKEGINLTSEPVAPIIPKGIYLSGGRGNRYLVGDVITETGRSVVFRGTSRTGLPVALKVGKFLEPDEHFNAEQSANWQKDANSLSPLVVPIEGFGFVEAPYMKKTHGTNPYPDPEYPGEADEVTFAHLKGGLFTLTVMPYYPEGSLAHKLVSTPPYPDHLRRNVLFTAAMALDDISGKYVHRDVKPGNFLLTTNDRAHLTDFDIAEIPGVVVRQADKLVGSAFIMSPEQVAPQTIYTRQTDIHGLTAGLALKFLDGYHLFFDKEDLVHLGSQEGYEKYLNWRLNGIAGNIQSVLRWGLAWNPADRPDTALEFTETFEHAWEHPTPPTVIYESGKHSDNPPDELSGNSRYRKSVQELIHELDRGKDEHRELPKTGDNIPI